MNSKEIIKYFGVFFLGGLVIAFSILWFQVPISVYRNIEYVSPNLYHATLVSYDGSIADYCWFAYRNEGDEFGKLIRVWNISIAGRGDCERLKGMCIYNQADGCRWLYDGLNKETCRCDKSLYGSQSA